MREPAVRAMLWEVLMCGLERGEKLDGVARGRDSKVVVLGG